MPKFFICVAALGLMLPCLSVASAAEITGYHPTYIPGYDSDGRLVVATRMFARNQIATLLVVDAQTLATRVIAADALALRRPVEQPGTGRYMNAADIAQSAYGAARRIGQTRPVALQNAGLIHAQHAVQGYFLTVDLCPSSRLFEAQFFQALVDRSRKRGAPVEVAICLSGLWAITHPEELSWLIAQQQRKLLHITWVNHSLSHLYFHDVPLEENFLLGPYIHVAHEMLATEEILLAHDEVPSIFFRYPGLVANDAVMQTLTHLGLVPLGADAWLAKGEVPTEGSVILVHGNANEPAGIQAVMPIITAAQPIALLPLAEAIIGADGR